MVMVMSVGHWLDGPKKYYASGVNEVIHFERQLCPMVPFFPSFSQANGYLIITFL